MSDPQQPNGGWQNFGSRNPDFNQDPPTQEIRLDQAQAQQSRQQPQQQPPQYQRPNNGWQQNQRGGQGNNGYGGSDFGRPVYGGQNGWQGQPQQHQQYQQAPHPGPYGRPPQRPAKKKSDAGIIIALVVSIVAVLFAIGVLGMSRGWFDFGSSSGSSSSNQQTSGQESSGSDSATRESSSSSSSSTTASTEARPKTPSLPSGAIPANESARNSEPAGDFNNVYRGTEITSEPFAQSVRDAFVEHYLDTKNTSGTIEAYSSVTGTSYTMNCRDNKQYVTCTGGNNAVVYIS